MLMCDKNYRKITNTYVSGHQEETCDVHPAGCHDQYDLQVEQYHARPSDVPGPPVLLTLSPCPQTPSMDPSASNISLHSATWTAAWTAVATLEQFHCVTFNWIMFLYVTAHERQASTALEHVRPSNLNTVNDPAAATPQHKYKLTAYHQFLLSPWHSSLKHMFYHLHCMLQRFRMIHIPLALLSLKFWLY